MISASFCHKIITLAKEDHCYKSLLNTNNYEVVIIKCPFRCLQSAGSSLPLGASASNFDQATGTPGRQTYPGEEEDDKVGAGRRRQTYPGEESEDKDGNKDFYSNKVCPLSSRTSVSDLIKQFILTTIYLFIFIYIYLYLFIFIYIYLYLFILIYTYLYLFIFMYLFLFTCLFIYILY